MRRIKPVTGNPKMPEAGQAIVPPAKVMDYLLSSEHPDGRSKAAFFVSFGFERAQADTLAEALRRHALSGRLTQTIETPFGVKYVVDGPVEAPDGRRPWLRTIWIADKNLPDNAPRFVTAYPGKGTVP